MLTINELRGKLTFTHNIKRVLESMKMMAAMNAKKSLQQYKNIGILYESLGQNQIHAHLNPDASQELLIIVGAKTGLCGNFLIELDNTIRDKLRSIKNDKVILIGGKFPKSCKVLKLEAMSIEKDFTFPLLAIVEQIWQMRNQIRCMNIYAWNIQTHQPECINISTVRHDKLTKSELCDDENLNDEILMCANSDDQNTTQLASINQKHQDYNTFSLQMFVLLKRIILSSLSKEDRLRFVTMDQAINNADDMARDLNNDVNQTRQTLITNELLEIVSGSEHSS